jgi:hypothetical protein
MTDESNMPGVADAALYILRMAIDDLGSCRLEPEDMRELDQYIIRLRQILKKNHRV